MKKIMLKEAHLLVSLFLLLFISTVGGLAPADTLAQSALKLAILEKMPKAQSAKRFEALYPQLTAQFRETFAKDGRFDLLPADQMDRAIEQAGVDKAKMDLDDTELLRNIGKRAGADVVFMSYYYEMGGHAMPMHSNNLLALIWVNTPDVVKIDREYSKVLSDQELSSSDALALKDLLDKAKELLPAR
jgi:hypothetical protein